MTSTSETPRRPRRCRQSSSPGASTISERHDLSLADRCPEHPEPPPGEHSSRISITVEYASRAQLHLLMSDSGPSTLSRSGCGIGRCSNGASQAGGELTKPLPEIPMLRCTRCGDERFIPLTFPGRKVREGVGAPVRPTAKCVTCGMSYIPPGPVPRRP